MEEFRDLEPYLPEDGRQKTPMHSVIDELNTPIFDRKGFDFMVSENTNIQSSIITTTINTQTADDPFKFEYELLRMDSVQTNKQSDDSITFSNDSNNNINKTRIQMQSNFANNNINNNIIQDSDANLLFSTSNDVNQQENLYIVNENETPMHVQIINDNIDNNNNNIDYTVNIRKIKNEIDILSPPPSNAGLETSEDSNSYAGSEISYKIPKLKLNLNAINETPTLNTPDVIDSVVDLERSFNILDYVNEKDVSTINLQDIQFDIPTTSSSTIVQNKPKLEIDEDEPSVIPTRKLVTNSRSRKRQLKRNKNYDDDDDDDSDEDYVPPPPSSLKRYKSTTKTTTKPYKKTKHKIKFEESDSGSDDTGISSISGSVTLDKNCLIRRTSSISSDYSDVSRYRELRDKNNEASRRSRLKRKMKELTLEKEADELTERNIKLKAQVEELEKMVSNFRNNLFKIMLKK